MGLPTISKLSHLNTTWAWLSLLDKIPDMHNPGPAILVEHSTHKYIPQARPGSSDPIRRFSGRLVERLC